MTEAQQGVVATRISSLLGNPLLAKVVEALVLMAAAYLITLLIKSLLLRLQQREVISGVVREQVYRLFSLTLYSIVGLFIVYMFTSAREVFYIILLIMAAVLFSNWKLIANVSAYYVMLLSRHMQRAAFIVEYPRLGIRGKIVEVTPLYVKVRGPGGRVYYVPNSIAIGEIMTQLAGVQTTARLRLILHGEPSILSASQLEKKIRQVLEESQLVPRARDAVVRILKASPEKAELEVEVPLVGAEPRPSTVNMLVTMLLQGLSAYRPVVEVIE